VHLFPQYEPLFTRLDATTLVLTPNQRLARFLVKQYDLWHSDRATTWPSLLCSSWSLWLQTLWDQAQTAGVHPLATGQILAPQQERLLWLQAIEQGGAPELLSQDSMAELAAQAWRYLKLWGRHWRELPDHLEEVRLFKSWAQAFQNLCDEQSQLDSGSVLERIAAITAQNLLPLPQTLILVGFDEMAPAEQALCEQLGRQGLAVDTFDPPMPGIATRIELVDRETELRRAARWAAALVERDNTASIGIVIPDLAQQRPLVERLFTQVFEPQALLPGQPRHAPGFNISAAQPLAQTPVIATALLALKLNGNDLERDQLSLLLASPFLGVEQELAARLKLDLRLRSRYITVPVTALRAEAGSKKSDCPEWHRQLQEMHQLIHTQRQKKQPFSTWASLFDRQLRALGWPGQRPLDTLEFQQHQHWPELLEQLAALDAVSPGPVTWQQALAELARLAYTPFHPETAASPVQVLGLLEAAGQPFDYLWVTGLDDRAWPEPIKPNPLLPLDLQRQWHMPRASVERELDLAARLTQRLATSASQVIFSSPMLDGDQPLRPSPLLESITLGRPEDLPDFTPADYTRQLLAGPLETLIDDLAPPILEPERLRGGSQILKNQAACPFKAFAIHRLHADESEDLQPGISPPVRGNLMHNALELIWKELQHQQALLDLPAQSLTDLIDNSIRRAWLQVEGQAQLGPRIKDLEQKRTAVLIRAWLELEKQRPPFRVVFQEALQQVQIGGIPLKVRYDRIDELIASDQHTTGDGLVVLDYKTGLSDIKAWAGDRPDEPQVPLYSILQGERLKAAVLAQLHVKEVAAKGISAEADMIPGLKAPDALAKLDLPDEWKQVLTFWRQTLEQLARDFIQGKAAVDPKHAVTTCQFCELHNLCRIRVTLADQVEDTP
jgi:probable DNA repair protein